MNRQTIVVVAALVTGLVVGYLWSEISDVRYRGHHDVSVPAGMHKMPDGSLMGNVVDEDTDYSGMRMMGGGMGHMMNMTVESEREFLEGMIPHHQEAVDTAKEVIARGGTTADIERLIENIVIAQEKEIADMKSWYEAWYGVPYADNGEYEPMMRDLSKLSGTVLDKVFLEDMIMHHMGAIMMAQSVQPYVEYDEIATLTQAIVTTQSKEISEMRVMLRGL
jgi:uncharacterized protein (DUF305 family)